MDWPGELGVSGLYPIFVEFVVVGFGEVVGDCRSEKALWDVRSHSQSAGIHRNFKQHLGARAPVLVALEEHRRAGKVLGEAAAGAGAAKGVGEQQFAFFSEIGCCGKGLLVEGIGHRDCASCQQLPYPAVRIWPFRCGQGGVLVVELRPEGAQD